jgi:predicted HTH domain antitoxin
MVRYANRNTGPLPPLPDDQDAVVLEKEPLQKIEAPFWRELRLMVAAKLYGAGRLSSERASKLADSPHVEFLLNLGFYKIFPLHTELAELEQEAFEKSHE